MNKEPESKRVLAITIILVSFLYFGVGAIIDWLFESRTLTLLYFAYEPLAFICVLIGIWEFKSWLTKKERNEQKTLLPYRYPSIVLQTKEGDREDMLVYSVTDIILARINIINLHRYFQTELSEQLTFQINNEEVYVLISPEGEIILMAEDIQTLVRFKVEFASRGMDDITFVPLPKLQVVLALPWTDKKNNIKPRCG